MKTLLGGFHFVFDHRIILGMISLDLFAVLFGGADMLLPIYAKDILHVGPQGLGWLRAALPAGSLLCALIVAHLPIFTKAGRALVWAVVVFGLATIGFGLSPWFWLSLTMLFICGMADTISILVRHTSVQLLTPDEMRGRVSSVNNLFISTSNDLGGFESGCGQLFLRPGFFRGVRRRRLHRGGGGGVLAASRNSALRQAGATGPAVPARAGPGSS